MCKGECVRVSVRVCVRVSVRVTVVDPGAPEVDEYVGGEKQVDHHVHDEDAPVVEARDDVGLAPPGWEGR